MSQKVPRILAIDPGTRQMGVAIVDGSGLVYYGVKSFKKKRPADELLTATRQVVLRLIQDFRPTILAYEKIFYVQAKNSALLKVQEGEIKRVGHAAGLRVVGYGPSTVRKLLCRDGRATKRQVADLLARRFPELARYLSTAAQAEPPRVTH